MKTNIFKIMAGVVLIVIVVVAFAWKGGEQFDQKKVLLYHTTQQAKSNLDYIDPTIGNLPQVLAPTYPVAHLPNQFIRVFPSRHNYADKEIANFPLSIVSHRTAKVFSVKPWAGKIDQQIWQTRLSYDRSQEENHPWYFSTFITNGNIKVEFTPGSKTGFYRFTFPGKAAKQLLFNVYAGKRMSKWSFNGNEITGMETYGKEVKVYMYGTFSANGTAVISNNVNQQQNGSNAPAPGMKTYISFPERAGDVIAFKYALSLISADQAKKNFNEEIKNKTFDQMTADAKAAWAESYQPGAGRRWHRRAKAGIFYCLVS